MKAKRRPYSRKRSRRVLRKTKRFRGGRPTKTIGKKPTGKKSKPPHPSEPPPSLEQEYRGEKARMDKLWAQIDAESKQKLDEKLHAIEEKRIKAIMDKIDADMAKNHAKNHAKYNSLEKYARQESPMKNAKLKKKKKKATKKKRKTQRKR